jgi:hypothetical protein
MLTATERSQRRYEKEQDELHAMLSWLEQDTHYPVPGGYGATPAERMDALNRIFLITVKDVTSTKQRI